MSDPINVRDLAVGTRVLLGSGAEVEAREAQAAE